MPRAKLTEHEKTNYKRNFTAENYDRISGYIPQGMKARIQEYCTENGTTINAILNEAFRNALGLSPEEWKKQD